ncbi:SDR family NAD(P)-dependent oxidoreductase [Brevibacterium sp. RIT 803]|uniref:SDR family NAD(P)-dependent oxidoreductase n=1 Tax=Brevibacterium sp. RIT 803 TaxID=2810210 RepID=UPI00194F9343|nr:SDR family NAD(P)-dependent oxidoreductase [Brevibacterium sp. RIT 803]
MEIHDQVAFITGGASGLGLATATRLLAAGGKVLIVDLPSSLGDDAAPELGENASFFAADVTSDEQVQDAVDAAAAMGPLRVVVNCAGIGGATLPVARDLASSKIRVISIGPGTFKTPLMQGASEETLTSLGAPK